MVFEQSYQLYERRRVQDVIVGEDVDVRKSCLYVLSCYFIEDIDNDASSVFGIDCIID